MTKSALPTTKALDECFAAARRYQQNVKVPTLAVQPSRQLIVLTCMDSRIDVFRILGLELGEAHVLRNAGGRATPDALRSIIISMNWLDTRSVLIVHHTDCGLHGRTNEQMATTLSERYGQPSPLTDFHAFGDLRESVRTDVEAVRACAHLPTDAEVRGGIYDVFTGQLVPVV